MTQGALPLGTPPPPLATGLGRIVVGRPAGGLRDGVRTYRIRVDGETRGKLRPAQYVVLDQPSGHYTVDARIDWTGSDEVGVDVFEGSVVHLKVEPRGSIWSQLWQALTPRGYLRLSLVEPVTSHQPPPD